MNNYIVTEDKMIIRNSLSELSKSIRCRKLRNLYFDSIEKRLSSEAYFDDVEPKSNISLSERFNNTICKKAK